MRPSAILGAATTDLAVAFVTRIVADMANCFILNPNCCQIRYQFAGQVLATACSFSS